MRVFLICLILCGAMPGAASACNTDGKPIDWEKIFREKFEKQDTDKNGFVALQEYLREFKAGDKNRKLYKERFQNSDKDTDGLLSFKEFHRGEVIPAC